MLPYCYQNDPRVRNARQLTAIANRPMMEGVVQLQEMYEAELKHLPEDEKAEKLSAIAESMKSDFTPRENRLINRCVDVVYGNGSFNSAKCTIRTANAYQTTGALQAAVVNQLIHGQAKTSGFSTGTQAVGHHQIIADIENLGLIKVEMN